jgi:hypothetical protein
VQRSPWITELGRPWVLAFAPGWSPLHAAPTELAILRTRVRDIGASLVVLSSDGVCWVRPDDELELTHCDELAGDLAKLSAAYGVSPERHAVFVIDATGMIRHASEPSSLVDALAIAERTLHAARSVVFGRREWIVPRPP